MLNKLGEKETDTNYLKQIRYQNKETNKNKKFKYYIKKVKKEMTRLNMQCTLI